MVYNLEDVKGIGNETAERLRSAGINSIEKLAELSIKELLGLNIKGIGKTSAAKYIENAKSLLQTESVKTKEEITEVEKKAPPSKKVPTKKGPTLKELIEKQAECNIGLVGHVDHGMIMSFRQFP